ncbi:hypothetical protein NLJ89_g8007 [Agrocybe chaxingu]|uniref:NAD(P)-binding protein n=1 Tax=Agrocybe chaxingu TaxID=84603 RepID=A0A9W8JWA0_9AGAR|nr:hypothetical protein NLJ89_g8007 [Agrocybe chaxingu]
MIFGRKDALKSKELIDITGKVAFVTGANRGIGYMTVKRLALQGATVYLGCRDETRGLEAVAALEREVADAYATASSPQPVPGKIVYHHCDLSRPELAKDCGDKFLERESRLDVLVNNAAALPGGPGISPHDVVTINHFGTFQLTEVLLPLLTKTSQTNTDVRIVMVSTNGHRMGRASDRNIRFRTREDYFADYHKDLIPPWQAYCVSKLALFLATKALQRRLLSASSSEPATHPITCISVHPGAVNTFSNRVPYLPGWLITPIVNLFFISPDAAARSLCYAAASPEVAEDKEKFRGAYLVPGFKIDPDTDITKNETLQDEVWESTVEILKAWPEAGQVAP